LSSLSHATVPDLLALDFDGVLCDGRAEYLESSWQVYCEIWDVSRLKLDQAASRFYQLRSVIETGWEIPLLLRSLFEGISDTEILENWSSLVQQMLDKSGLTKQEMTRLLDEKRDRWIENNEQDWLAHHEFYPGVIQRLQAAFNEPSPQVYIITTKEGRFARKLLQQHGIQFPRDYIIGKEYQQPKTETLTELLKQQENASLWFVEDRFKTLLTVAQAPYLQSVRLFLADWGYNTARSRQQAANHPQIQLLSLNRFNQDFSHW